MLQFVIPEDPIVPNPSDPTGPPPIDDPDTQNPPMEEPTPTDPPVEEPPPGWGA